MGVFRGFTPNILGFTSFISNSRMFFVYLNSLIVKDLRECVSDGAIFFKDRASFRWFLSFLELRRRGFFRNMYLASFYILS